MMRDVLTLQVGR